MIILDKPYVSQLMLDTIQNLNIPILHNEFASKIITNRDIYLLDEKEFIQSFTSSDNNLLYSNSENTISWIVNHLSNTKIPERINVFKDKIKFRELISGLYSDFFYTSVKRNDLEKYDVSKIKKPFIIKPAVGFFSVGVHKINSDKEWEIAKIQILKELENAKELYPNEVINNQFLIIEEYAEGEEFAIDAYYNEMGKPIILNLFKHLFSSDNDVSDRVYVTSKELVEAFHSPFIELLSNIGEMIELKNFPVHVEVRVNPKNNRIIPIEINPMRFAGWCTTDIAYYAYGINVYEYYYKQKEPDWETILKDKDNKIYSIVVADTANIENRNIKEIQYGKLLSKFKNPIELRKIDYHQYPVFAFLFVETEANNQKELKEFLRVDMKEFIQVIEG